MALETFKAQLKAKAKTLGVTNLSNKRIDAYAATLEKQNPNLTTDDDHAERIETFLELVDIKEVAAMDDRNRSQAGKDGKQTPGKADAGKGNEGTETPTETPADDANLSPEMKALMNTVKTLAETVGKLQTEKTQASMQSRLKETLTDVPASFYKKWALPAKEEDFDAFVEEVKTEWAEFTKENPVSTTGGNAGGAQTSGGAGGHKPGRGGGGANDKASKEEVEAIIGNIM